MATITSLDFNINSHWDGSGVASAKRDIEELQASLRTISDANVRINVDDGGARASIDQLRASLDSLSNHSVKIDVDDSGASAKIDALKAKIDSLRDKTVHIRADADDSSVTRLNNSLNNTQKSGQNAQHGISLMEAGLALLPAAINPIAPAILGVTGATIAMGASGGAALGAFGLATMGAVKSTLEMKASLGAVKDQLEQHKATLALLTPGTAAYAKEQAQVNKYQDEYNHALAAADPAQRRFIQATDQLSESWGKFIKSTQAETLKPLSTVLEAVAGSLSKLKPVVDAVAPVVQKLADDFKKWTQDGGLQRFIDVVDKDGVPALKALVVAGKDVISVLGDGFRAFAPLGVSVAQALERGAAALKSWADGGGFSRFLETVKKDAPSVKEFFTALEDATKNVGTALAELGPLTLSLTTNLLKLIAALPPTVLAVLVAGWEAYRVAMLAWSIIAPIVTSETFALAAAEIAASAPLVVIVGVILLVVAVFVALGVVIYLLITHWKEFATYISSSFMTVVRAVWDGLKEFGTYIANSFMHAWDGVKGAWDAVWNALKTATTAVWNALKTAWSATVNGLKTAWDTVSNGLKTAWTAVWDALKTAGQTVWNAIKTAWQTTMTGLKTAWDTVSNALKTAWTAVWNALKTAGETVWNAIKTAWTTAMNGLKTAWDTVSNALKTAWTTVWNALKTTGQTIWNAIKTAWQTTMNGLKTAWDTVSNALKTAWNTVWNALKTAAQTVWNAMKTAWTTFLNAIKTAWTTVSNALKTAWNTVWNALKTAAQTVWNAIKTAWDTILNALKTAWDTFSNALKTAWQVFWDAIKTAAQTVWDAVKTAWQTLVDAVKQIWDTASDALKTAWENTWNALKSTASRIWDDIKTVISDAVNIVIGIINGLIGAWDAVAGAVGLPTIGKLSPVGGGGGGGNPSQGGNTFRSGGGGGGFGVNAAEGGVLGGYEPGIDTVPAMLSKGEGILVPEAVRGLGADFVHGANHHFSGGRAGSPSDHFARGGIAHFAVGGVLSEIPVPGGGTAGQTATPGQTGGTNDPGSGIGIGIPGLPSIAEVTAKFMEWIGKFHAMTGPLQGPLGAKGAEVGMKMLEKVIAAIQAAIAKALAAAGGVLGKLAAGVLGKAGSGNVSNLSALALAALRQAGIPDSQLQNFLTRINIESSGNPNAINNWDINAQNGIPSQGLGQIIPPNFATYHAAGTSNNILDPQANLYASANYIKATYGNSVPTGAAYATGTNAAAPGWHTVGENGPEAVNFGGGGGQVKSFEDTIKGIAAGVQGGGGMTRQELGDALSEMSGGVSMPVNLSINGATDSDEVMRRIESELLPKLNMMLRQHVGRRGK